MPNSNRARHRGYRSAAEIRTKKIIDLIFAFIATAAICVQLVLLYNYFQVNSKKNKISNEYKTEEQVMNVMKNQKLEKQRFYNALSLEIENLEAELERLKLQ